jgi:hypothetical protein
LLQIKAFHLFKAKCKTTESQACKRTEIVLTSKQIKKLFKINKSSTLREVKLLPEAMNSPNSWSLMEILQELKAIFNQEWTR